MTTIRGVLCPTVTLFDEAGRIDIEGNADHVGRLLKAGLQGTVPMGTMGECTHLTMEERKRVIEAAQEATPAGKLLLAGDIFPGTQEAVDFARWLADLGVDGVLAMSPFYIKPKEDGIVAHYRALTKVAGGNLWAYNLPGFSGYSLPNEVILRLAQEGTIQGLKDSEGDLGKIASILADRPRDFAVMTGADPILLGTVAYGGEGGILGTSNVFPRLCLEAYEAAQRGDLHAARPRQMDIVRVSEAIQTGAFPAATRYMVGRVWGLATHNRTPVVDLTAEERAKVDGLLEPLLKRHGP